MFQINWQKYDELDKKKKEEMTDEEWGVLQIYVSC